MADGCRRWWLTYASRLTAAAGRSGSSRSPTALMWPASFSSAHVVMPQASRSQTSGSSSMTSGGVRLCGSDSGPSKILTAPHGATRTSTPGPARAAPAGTASSARPSPTPGVAKQGRQSDDVVCCPPAPGPRHAIAPARHARVSGLFQELLPCIPSWHRSRKIFHNANDGIRCDAEHRDMMLRSQ